MSVVVSCKRWDKGDDLAMLEAHATTDHSDVCLSYLFTSHDFGGVLGNISQLQVTTRLIILLSVTKGWPTLVRCVTIMPTLYYITATSRLAISLPTLALSTSPEAPSSEGQSSPLPTKSATVWEPSTMELRMSATPRSI